MIQGRYFHLSVVLALATSSLSALTQATAPPGWRGPWMGLMDSPSSSEVELGASGTGTRRFISPIRPRRGERVVFLTPNGTKPSTGGASRGDTEVRKAPPGWCVLSNVCMDDFNILIVMEDGRRREELSESVPKLVARECTKVAQTRRNVRVVPPAEVAGVPFLHGNTLALDHYTARSHPAHFADHLMVMFTYFQQDRIPFPLFSRLIYAKVVPSLFTVVILTKAPPPRYDLAEHLFNIAIGDLVDPTNLTVLFGFPRVLCMEHAFYPSKAFPMSWLFSPHSRKNWLARALPSLSSPPLEDACGPPNPGFLLRKEERYLGDPKNKLRGIREVFGLDLLSSVFREAGFPLKMVTTNSSMSAEEQAAVFRAHNLVIAPHTSQRLLCMYARQPSAHVELLAGRKVWARHWQEWCSNFGHEFRYAFGMVPWVPSGNRNLTRCLMAGRWCGERKQHHAIFRDMIVNMTSIVASVNNVTGRMAERCPGLGWEKLQLKWEENHMFPHPEWRPKGPWNSRFDEDGS